MVESMQQLPSFATFLHPPPGLAFPGVVPAGILRGAPPGIAYGPAIALPAGGTIPAAGGPQLNTEVFTAPAMSAVPQYTTYATALNERREPHIIPQADAPQSSIAVPPGLVVGNFPYHWAEPMPDLGAQQPEVRQPASANKQLAYNQLRHPQLRTDQTNDMIPLSMTGSAFLQNQIDLLNQLIGIYTYNPSQSLYNNIMTFRAHLHTVMQSIQPVSSPNTYRGYEAGIPPVQPPMQDTQFPRFQENLLQRSTNTTRLRNGSSAQPVIPPAGELSARPEVHVTGDRSSSGTSQTNAARPPSTTRKPPTSGMAQITHELDSDVNGSLKVSQIALRFAQSTISTVGHEYTDERSRTIAEDKLEWNPDIYADTFIPSWVKNVNAFSAVKFESTRPPEFDLEDYVRGFAGIKLVSREVVPQFRYEPPVVSTRRPDLSASTYKSNLYHLIDLEIKAQKEELKTYNMYGVPLDVSDREKALFMLKCPGIREFTPSVSIGDLLLFRQLRPQYSTSDNHAFTGYEYSGYIWHVDRSKGEVIVRIDGLAFESNLFNVQFVLDDTFHSKCAIAVEKLHEELQTEPSGFVRKMLFPEDEDGVMQETLSSGLFDLEWYDNDLNYEQQRAIDSILKGNYGNVPFLISGPPGTGKTKTIVELALQLVKKYPRCHILLCAPSDAAADTLALRLRYFLSNKELFRLNHSTRAFAEVPTELLSFCAIDLVDSQDMFVMPEFKTFMSFKIVVCSCRDANILSEAQYSNKSLAKIEGYMMEAFGNSQRTLHWSALLIDEAGQGTEPETVIPLRVILPDMSHIDEIPIVVMAGDHRQLGPRTVSRQDQESELDISLFERLMARPLYAEHPLARKQQLRNGRRPKLPYVRPAFSNLVRNYRSHPALLAVPSSLFYYDTLLCEATNINTLCVWERLPNRNMPILFIENKGQDEMVEEGVSWFNTDEINLCCTVVKDLVDRNLVRPFEIAVAAPFREQIRRIRHKLRQQHLRDVNVGPVESYQGAEHRAVIVCTTRTRDRFIESDYRKGMGMIHEAKRFNVAITRAKELLVIIGNSDILQRDGNWRALLSFCYRNTLFDKIRQSEWKPSQDEINTPLYYSRIEHGIAYKSRTSNKDVLAGQVIDDPMWLAGFASEDAYLNT
ncbi:P-loop containing nucleoside triphosphate hydrolase protein [Lipomyces tetrasporus]|uniref:RNA helicase n=1 Tax=Lipomyces tetrasporus TaxID=54092 RepID=A0AAD7QQL0_9ASCO|nr:P-loop containing nucleoside triphosphate hydrolase protein [Lipomyces tetrasporus]KAJ8099688.1 P-loop containing nucleoside triphosphate hydrolase protein [Lipomyces tetrasporus]